MRPPELRKLFRQVGNYFRWFIVIKKRLGWETLESVLDISIWNSLWIDGLQNQVCLRLKALPEVIQHLESMQISSCSDDPEYMMKNYFMKINHYHNMFLEDHNYGSDTDQ